LFVPVCNSILHPFNGVNLLEEVRKSKVKNDEVVKAVEEIKQAGVKMLKDKK